MLPMVGVPETVRKGLRPYRDLFRRDEGFEYVSRYVIGLLVNPNKTLQGISATQVWLEKKPSRRAMHEAVFEAGWDAGELLPRHRALIAPGHRNRGREVISLDWTLLHHERGPHIYGVTKSYMEHKLAYQKRTEIVVAMVRQLEEEGRFPQADYAFDNGGLTPELTRFIASKGKRWVSELESSRLILWQEHGRRIDEVATELRQHHPESFRRVIVRCRNGEKRENWAFTKTVRLSRYARKRIALVHERADLTDAPRFLLTDALHWESGRMIRTWNFRWAAEVFHEFSKQGMGLEAAQVRNEEAVKRHLRLSCLAQSLLQRTPTIASTSEQFAFAKGEQTFGQRCRAITREVFHSLLAFAQRLFAGGSSCEQVMEALMPA